MRTGKLRVPKFILHVDEHHDMMDERRTPNIVNFIYHAMSIWPDVRVHWMVNNSIDTPAMWSHEDTWQSVSDRFTMGASIPYKWPRPQLISVCMSPEFVASRLRNELLSEIKKSMMIHRPSGRGR